MFALEAYNSHSISGVVVIDDQPDIVSVADSQEGFQEVLSKKERRNRKDLHQQDDTVQFLLRFCFVLL